MKVVYETMMEKIRQAKEDAIRQNKKIAYIELTPAEMMQLGFEVYQSGPLCGDPKLPNDFLVHGVKIVRAK